MAIEFDGVDQSINIPGLTSLANVTAATIMAWVLIPDDNVDTCTVLDISVGTGTGTRAALIARTTGGGGPSAGLSVQARGADGDALQSANTPGGLFGFGIWFHFTGVILYDRDIIQIYRDGFGIVGTAVTLSSPTSNTPSVSTRIGVDASGAGDFTTGLVADVRVYDRALESGELRTIVAAKGNDGILTGARNIWPLRSQPPGFVASGVNSIIDLGGNPTPGEPLNSPIYRSDILVSSKRPKISIGFK